jgi:threonylcarbamoyladenosine tRNA methylthiotransferase MtaB
VIPFVRGNSRSLALQEVIRECQALVEAGYREVVISGINLGRWGRDLPGKQRFPELVRSILDHTDLQRLRISSVEPMDWTDDLIELVASSPRIAKHAHVPLQSGSDPVLRRMHRKYRPWHYAEKIRKIRAAMPEAAIGADVMAGFPGESEEEFEQNRRFIEELPFTYLHVFSYSSRPGTAAAAMPGHLPVEVIHRRNRTLRELSDKKNREFRENFLGTKLEAITLHAREDGDSTEALSSNFLKVQIEGCLPANELLQVQIESLSKDGLRGKPAPVRVEA